MLTPVTRSGTHYTSCTHASDVTRTATASSPYAQIWALKTRLWFRAWSFTRTLALEAKVRPIISCKSSFHSCVGGKWELTTTYCDLYKIAGNLMATISSICNHRSRYINGNIVKFSMQKIFSVQPHSTTTSFKSQKLGGQQWICYWFLDFIGYNFLNFVVIRVSTYCCNWKMCYSVNQDRLIYSTSLPA